MSTETENNTLTTAETDLLARYGELSGDAGAEFYRRHENEIINAAIKAARSGVDPTAGSRPPRRAPTLTVIRIGPRSATAAPEAASPALTAPATPPPPAAKGDAGRPVRICDLEIGLALEKSPAGSSLLVFSVGNAGGATPSKLAPVALAELLKGNKISFRIDVVLPSPELTDSTTGRAIPYKIGGAAPAAKPNPYKVAPTPAAPATKAPASRLKKFFGRKTTS